MNELQGITGPKTASGEDTNAEAEQRSIEPQADRIRAFEPPADGTAHQLPAGSDCDLSKARASAFARAAAVAVVVVIIDQVTKQLVRSGLAPGEEHKIIPGIKIVHVRNTGVAFSLFSSGGTLVLVFTLLALGLVVGYLALRPTRHLLWLPTGMLVGGAIGNLIDRISKGAVTDFIKLPAWPAFNFADISITFGVLILLWVIESRSRTSR
jgi:signal peptidase II